MHQKEMLKNKFIVFGMLLGLFCIAIGVVGMYEPDAISEHLHDTLSSEQLREMMDARYQ